MSRNMSISTSMRVDMSLTDSNREGNCEYECKYKFELVMLKVSIWYRYISTLIGIEMYRYHHDDELIVIVISL